MKERPILFSAPMVRAILDGRKTVTRRVVKPQPENRGVMGVTRMLAFKKRTGPDFWLWPNAKDEIQAMCPYGRPGDRLWVREAHSIFQTHGQHRADDKRWGPWDGLPTQLSADGTQIAYYREGFDRCDPGRWRPSIHMPRWASRITLEVTSVRVERLKDITEAGAIADGVDPNTGLRGDDDLTVGAIMSALPSAWRDDQLTPGAIARFILLWDTTNGKRPGHINWNANPFVWVVEFKRIAQQVSA